MEKEITLDNLSTDQLEALAKQYEERKQAEAKKVQEERATYKSMVDATVNGLYPIIEEASKKLAEVKQHVFGEFRTLVQMKAELYNRKEDQFSHTFSSADGNITITIGRNISDGWDDTVNTGIAKVNDFIQGMAKDENSKNLVNTVLRLLSKDKSGNLKASRVLQLKKMAEDVGDANFIDAIKIIQDAYRPKPSQEYIKCTYTNEAGAKVILPLSISEATLETIEEDKLVEEDEPAST